VGILFLLKIAMSSGGKFEEFPGNKVTSITSVDVWNNILQDPLNKGKLILIDFYAVWCPPCRRASPIYGRMSIEFDDVLFLKVDVDVMPELMRDQNVRAMPTFQLYRDHKQLDHVVGFDEQKIKLMLGKHRSAKVIEPVGADVSDVPSKNKAT
jgi:thioredoxin 1